jgi:hypothetical protein
MGISHAVQLLVLLIFASAPATAFKPLITLATCAQESQAALFAVIAAADRCADDVVRSTGGGNYGKRVDDGAQQDESCKYVALFAGIHADLKRGNRAKNVDAFQREFASAFERSTPIGTPIPSAQAAVDAGLLFLRPSKVFDKGNWKEQKICCGCCRPLTWRKKWERCWSTVYTCSNRCKGEFRRGVAACTEGGAADTPPSQSEAAGDETEPASELAATSSEERTSASSFPAGKVATQPGVAGGQYPYPTGNIWSFAHRGDLKAVKSLLFTGRLPGASSAVAGARANSNTDNDSEPNQHPHHQHTPPTSIPIPPGLRNKVGWTPLHAAAAGGHDKVVAFLLSHAVAAKAAEERKRNSAAAASAPNTAQQQPHTHTHTHTPPGAGQEQYCADGFFVFPDNAFRYTHNIHTHTHVHTLSHTRTRARAHTHTRLLRLP